MTHRWTDEEREIVRRDYRHTTASAQGIADRLSRPSDRVTLYGVKGQVSIMGLSKRNDRRPWTPKEKERLRELIGKYCPVRIAKMMHRSINSVVVMSKRLGCSRRSRDGWFTKREVCEILGMDHKWVQRRIDSGAINATYHFPDRRPTKLGYSCWHIEENDLRQFIRKYPQELTSRNVDLIMIVDILAGLANNNH